MNRPWILCVRFAVLSALLVGLFTHSISMTAEGQAKDQSSTGNQAPFQLKVESNLVVVRVVVRDAHRKAAEGLKREDFKIFDRGKEQSITQFEESSGAPSSSEAGRPASAEAPERFIALFFDSVVVQMRGALDRYAASSNTSVTQAMQTLDAQAGLVASDVLAELAQGTGGDFVHGNNDLKSGFDKLAGRPANYTIAFVPKNMKLDGNFHAMKVTLARKEKGYDLQAMRNYFAVASTPVGLW